jgi:hypothetical protein
MGIRAHLGSIPNRGELIFRCEGACPAYLTVIVSADYVPPLLVCSIVGGAGPPIHLGSELRCVRGAVMTDYGRLLSLEGLRQLAEEMMLVVTRDAFTEVPGDRVGEALGCAQNLIDIYYRALARAHQTYIADGLTMAQQHDALVKLAAELVVRGLDSLKAQDR